MLLSRGGKGQQAQSLMSVNNEQDWSSRRSPNSSSDDQDDIRKKRGRYSQSVFHKSGYFQYFVCIVFFFLFSFVLHRIYFSIRNERDNMIASYFSEEDFEENVGATIHNNSMAASPQLTAHYLNIYETEFSSLLEGVYYIPELDGPYFVYNTR